MSNVIHCFTDYKAAIELQRKQQYQKKILTLEEAFNKIKAATHVNDLDEVKFETGSIYYVLYDMHTKICEPFWFQIESGSHSPTINII